MKQTVVIGITSGIAAYKTIDLISLLRKENIDVFVIMTASSSKMVSPKEFEKASGNKVFIHLFEKDFDYKKILQTKTVDHIALADKADLLVISPATANVIAKIAHGIADDFLTTTVLAATSPILICPSMNCNMWENPITKENISRLQKLNPAPNWCGVNYHFVDPQYGDLACGYQGMGRLADTQTIFDKIKTLLKQTSDFKGKKILVTSGGTIEPIDPVRVITNKSSGKMGTRIAQQAFLRGADVILVRSINSVKPNYAIKEELFTDTNSLFTQIKKHIGNVDIVIHAAAVSDFSVKPQTTKIKSGKKIILELNPTEKIIDKLKKLNPKIFLVGFKAEVNTSEKELINNAFALLKRSQADVIVANDVAKKNAGFDSDSNEVIIVDKQKQTQKIPLASKQVIADKILDEIKMNFPLSS